MSRFAIDRLALGSLCSTIIAIAGCGGGALPSPALDAAASFDFAPLDRSVPLDLDEPDLAAPPDLAEPDLTPVACASDSDCGPLIDGGPVAARCCGGYCVSASDPANCGACGVVCGSGRCGSALSASMATQPDNWSWNGDAFWDALSGSTFLTDMSNWEAGTVVYQDPIAVDAFDVRFDFLMLGGADGMGFLLETDGPTAVGVAGGGLAMAKLHGYGVELDEWNNDTCGDRDANHAAVDRLSECNAKDQLPTMLQATDDLAGAGIHIADGSWHTCAIHVAAGAATVSLDGKTVLDAVPLPGLVDGTPYYFGFAGATGGAGDIHQVKDVSIAFPTPRCL